MSSYDVTLSSATRQNLRALQDTAALTATNQNRLSTGKKVNSALDNPVNYFTAASLSDRAGALNSLLDGISNGIQTIQAASKGIDSMTTLVKQLQATVKQAQTSAATNLPKVIGTATSTYTGGGSGLADASEAVAAGKSQHDTALAKGLFGTSAKAATSSSVGNMGLTAATGTDSNVFRIQAGSTTYDVALSASATVSDLVNGINKSGVATASIDSSGQLNLIGVGSDALTLSAGTKAADGTFTPVSAETTALFGSATIAGVTGAGTSAQRSALIAQFNDTRDQIDQLARDAGYNGTNLLAGDRLSILFNEKTGSAVTKLDVQGTQLTAASLGVGKFVDSSNAQSNGDFGVQNNADLLKATDGLTNALVSLRALSSTLGSNLTTVQTRQDFTKKISDILTVGSAYLTDADMNEEAANSQALSTRQSLGISALSLSNQAQQGILQLLR